MELEQKAFIQSNEIQSLYRSSVPSSVGIIIITLAVWITFNQQLSAVLLNGWTAVMLLVAGSRILLKFKFNSSFLPQEALSWGRVFTLNTTIAGIGWGVLSISIPAANDPAYQIAIVLILLGVIGASVPLLYYYLPAFLTSSLPSALILPFVINYNFGETRQLLTLAILLFIALCYYITFKSHKSFTNTSILEFEKNRLVNSLRMEVMNRESIVNQRTNELQQGNQDLSNEIELRKKSEEQLQDALEKLQSTTRELTKSESFLNAIIDHLPTMIFVKDVEKLKFVLFNRAGEKLLGKTSDQMIGKSDHDFFPAKQAEFFITNDRKVIETGLVKNIEEEPIDTPQGTRILHTRKVCIKDDNGHPEYLLGISNDITERARAEAYLEKNANILEMIASGHLASEVYNQIALMIEERHPGMRCSLLELKEGKLIHGGAPSLPLEYCEAVNGLEYGPSVGSCGTSTYTGKRVIVENIENDPKWAEIKHLALAHNLRCCWSEPICSSSGKVLGAFGMYYGHPAKPNEDESSDLKSGARLAGIVMERDQAQKRIKQLAYTDELTGIANRHQFYLTLEDLIKTSHRYQRRFGLLYIDLDNFKSVNDSLGHDIGDILLRKIAGRLEKVSREIDYVARLSGDEFCILVTGIKDDYSASHVAQRCLDEVSLPIELSSRKFTPSCSIGVSLYPDDGKDIATLTKAADTSLYDAKARGKGQYAFYRPELTHEAEYRFKVEGLLREAIIKQQLSLVYQPQVDIHSRKIIGFEALSRWHHPQLGHVSPNEFIAIAERTGMIKPLTEWVLKQACSQAVAWREANITPLRIAVNISPSHFLDREFVPLIKHILSDTDMVATDLELEVTENIAQTDNQNLSIFKDVKDLGAIISIDDFGTGYSSFASLKHLTVDNLKIDRHFIKDILNDHETRLLVGSMIEMGHNLGHRIIAEGVETQEQLSLLQELGCDTAQGYLFSKGVGPDEILELLENTG